MEEKNKCKDKNKDNIYIIKDVFTKESEITVDEIIKKSFLTCVRTIKF